MRALQVAFVVGSILGVVRSSSSAEPRSNRLHERRCQNGATSDDKNSRLPLQVADQVLANHGARCLVELMSRNTKISETFWSGGRLRLFNVVERYTTYRYLPCE